MKKVFIGDTGEYLAQAAQKVDTNAILVTEQNVKQISDQDHGVYYSSLGDFRSIELFCKFLLQADEIIYCPEPNGQWSDSGSAPENGGFTLESETIEHLLQWSWIKKIPVKNLEVNFDQTDFGSYLSIYQSTPERQIWSFGCSITAGSGVESDQIYSNLVAKEFGLPITRIAHGGASVRWAADQILTADVKAGDLVIWGITSARRYSYILHSKRFYHVVPNFYKNYPLIRYIINEDWLMSPNTVYESLKSISMVNNYCRKINAHLIMLGVMPEYTIMDHLMSYTNFVPGPKKFIDTGSDRLHPGPRHHQKYADIVLDFVAKQDWI